MSELDLMKLLWIISTLTCAGCVIGMLFIYKSMEQSLDLLTNSLVKLNKEVFLRYVIGRDHASRVQGVAKNTEMAE